MVDTRQMRGKSTELIYRVINFAEKVYMLMICLLLMDTRIGFQPIIFLKSKLLFMNI